MKREIITIDEYGRLNIPTDTVSVWMTEAEIVELFGTTAGTIRAAYQSHSQRKRPARLRGLHVYPSGQRQSGGRI